MIIDQNKVVKLALRSLPSAVANTLEWKQFEDVLYNRIPITVKQPGFNFILGRMLQEVTQKKIVTPLYLKRYVYDDFSTTTLLL